MIINLSTTYLGLPLNNPIVCSSSPLCDELDMVRTMEDMGAGAVILPSLFEEQLEMESHHLNHGLNLGTESFAEGLSYLPDLDSYNLGPDRYLDHLRAAREAADIPIIASLNGNTEGGWVRYAKYMEDAGASAIELNIYDVVIDPLKTSSEIEAGYVNLVRMLKEQIDIPLAIKLSPYFSALPNVARRLVNAGADGLVLFNRFYQPDLDIEELRVRPSLNLSSPHELRPRLRWVSLLHGVIHADLAVTGGVHSGLDVLKCMMAGASVAMTTSALLQKGAGWIATMTEEMTAWMEEHEYTDLNEMRGCLSRLNAEGTDALERANYLKVLSAFMPRSPY